MILLLIFYLQPLASEISSQLFSDEDMKYIYKKIDESLTWCEVCVSISYVAISCSDKYL